VKAASAGFTLLEVIVSVFLVGLCVLTIVPLFLYATQSSAVSSDLTGVGTVAVRRMELLRAQEFKDIAAGGSLTSDMTGFSDTSNPSFTVRWTVTFDATPPTRKTIDLRAQARRRVIGQRKEVVLTTARTE
jgi:prepilin-type N-terminal cleavage/methylation domain-containing protein